MHIDERDFQSFITIKKNLAKLSVKHCMIRLRVINGYFIDKELNKENVEKFFLSLKEQGLKNNSLNTYRFVFLQLVDYCKDRGLPYDFLDGFKSFKKEKADIVIFTLEEIEKIINTKLEYGKLYGKDCSFLDFRYRTLTMFLAYTGCRYSEAANLIIKRVDLSAGKATFVNTKTNENRTIYFAEPLKTNLKKLIEGRKDTDFVFRNSLEKQVQAGDYSEDLKKRAKKAGVRKRTFPHDFRHSYITNMLEADIPITIVASLVGHKDIRTTYSTYMHLADKTLQKASMRHPLVRKNVEPHEIMTNIKEILENQHLEADNRFSYHIKQGDESLEIKIQIKR